MNDDTDGNLGAQLAALRAALGSVHAPADGEDALRAALRARRVAVQPTSSAAHDERPCATREPALDRVAAPRRSSVWLPSLALAAALAVVAVTSLLTLRSERGTAPQLQSAVPPGSPAVAARAPASAFQPLAFSPALSPKQSYAVVRVRIPLAALAPGHAAASDASIDADVLVGDDGLPAGIRFDSADTLYVSTISN